MKHLDTYIFKDCLLGRFICIFDCGIATLIFSERSDGQGDNDLFEVYSWIKSFQRFKDTGISMDFQGLFCFGKQLRIRFMDEFARTKKSSSY